jgi:hypothetical protein
MFGLGTRVRRSRTRGLARRGAEKPAKCRRTTVFECLEERCCPSTVDVWLGGTGNYSNPANWSLGVVPNNGNLVGGQPATFTVEIAGGQHNNSAVMLDTSASIDNLAIDATNLLSIADGRSLTIVGGSGTEMITNSGTIALDSTGDNTSLQITGNVSLTGGGTVTLSKSTANLIDGTAANSTLTSVDNTIKGSGQIGGGLSSFDNQGTIVAGASSNLTLDARFVTNEGTIQAGGGGMIAVTGPGGYAQNSGLTSVAAHGSFAITFDDNQTGGATTVDGTLSATTTNIGGTLSGIGTINGPVSVSGTGTVSPGDASARGSLNVSGNYTQASGGVLNIALGGSTPGVGGFSVLNVTGTATLATGSILDVSVVGGFMPSNNETFQFLNGQSLTGSFAQSSLQQGNATFTVGYNPAFAVLTAQVPVAPSATTLAASGVTNVAATLNGSVNPQRSATTVTFVYGTDPTLMSGTTTTTGQAIGNGTSAMAVSAALTGLQSATTYYDEIVATSANGTTDGAILSFFTPGPSTATTEAATAVTSTTATLNASVNPEGSATTVAFVYGTDPTLMSGTTTTTGQAIGSGTSAMAVTAALTGLEPGTTYYEQVVATSAEGTTDGAILSFSTPNPPAATTQAATTVTTTTATLNASVNPNGSATTVTFVYGTDPTLATGTTTTAAQAIGGGSSGVAVSAPLTGLEPGTTYYEQVVATSAEGTMDGVILSFSTPSPPTATTEAATAVTTTTATLNASVNPEGSATTVTFVYGTDPTLATGTTTTAAQAIGGGTSTIAVTAALTGLEPGTTYYEQVVATSAEGTTHGAIVSFVAPAQPVATTVESTAGTPQSATAGRAFAPLVATVLDQNGNPLGGVSVTFAAPSTGAGGAFAGGLATATVTTGADGVATAPTFVANGVAGGYVVTASVAGLSTPASFHLNNTAAATATVQFASAQFSASATDGSATIVLTRTGNFSAGVTVVLSSPGGPDVAALQETVTVGPDVTSVPVSIPIQNDGKPNQPDVVIPLALSSASAGAALGAVTSAGLVVHDNNPLPAPVTVSLQLVPVNVATGGHRAMRTTAKTGLQLTFSGAINGAGNVAAYHLFSGTTRRHVTTFSKAVALASVQYNPSALTATLVPRSKLALTKPEQLQLTAALLTDAFGRALDGKHNGQPGSNFVANFSKKGIQIERARSAP